MSRDNKRRDSKNNKMLSSTKSGTEKKKGFKRYRDDSKPSDLGSGTFTKEFNSEQKPFSEKKYNNKPEKSTFKKYKSDSSEKFTKKEKSFDKKQFRKNENEEFDFSSEENDNKSDRSIKHARPYERKPYQKKTFHKKSKSTSHKPSEDGTIRLNKYISNAGICSRREADELISTGVVSVNGKIITEMGYKVKPTDIIKYGGQTLKKERMVYLLLNKPKDYISTIDDPQKRKTVLELVHNACKERIYPVGRLDRATTGLLLFTNDGELTKRLTHPRYGVRKIYQVSLDKPLKKVDFDKIVEGVELEDGIIKVDEISYVGDGKDKSEIGIEIHSGKNRIVRRLFEHFGYNIRKLDRVMFGPLTKKDLPRGRWRFLSEAELGMLKMVSSD